MNHQHDHHDHHHPNQPFNHHIDISSGNPPPHRRRKLKSSRGCCVIVTLNMVLLLLIAAATYAVVSYFVLRPTSLKFSISSIYFTNNNNTNNQTSPAVNTSPAAMFPVVLAYNPSKKIGIFYYQSGSEMSAYFSSARLAQGRIPGVYQPPGTSAEFYPFLTWLVPPETVEKALPEAQAAGKIPLALKIKVPVRFKWGLIKTLYRVNLKVNCDVTVNELTVNATVLSESCRHRIGLW